MEGTYTIVLDNSERLRLLCGIHDNNISMLEKLIGSEIKTRGNEIILFSGSDETRLLFRKIIDNLDEHIKLGQQPDSALVEAVYRSLASGAVDKAAVLKNNRIKITGTETVIFPRSYNQAEYIKGLESSDLVFGIGPAGTGKTYLAVAHALNDVLNHRRKKIVLTRPVVEAGESLGFLPGDLAQKINPYLRPLYDAMDALVPFEVLSRLEEKRIIEIAPLAYMRGRSLNNSYIILDEAQNTTKEQMKMFLTRIGEGSKAVITGDTTQIDLPKKDNSGLIHALKILKHIDDIHFTYLDSGDVVRNPLVRKIIKAYENEH